MTLRRAGANTRGACAFRKSIAGRIIPYPLWQGEALAGKRVLVQAEQGLGDQIMFGSCLPDVVSRAQHTIIECTGARARAGLGNKRGYALYHLCYGESGGVELVAFGQA